MSTATLIPFEAADPLLDWNDLADFLIQGHNAPKAKISDTFLHRDGDTLLNRSAWIEGLGIAVKCATIFPENAKVHKPAVNGAVNLLSDTDGCLEAILDFHLVTKWKTAGDSVTAARALARPDSENILIVGAGTVGRSLYEAYSAVFPKARFTLWNRSLGNAHAMANGHDNIVVCEDLEQAVKAADIITSATMSYESLIKGEWLNPGQHIDLIGAFRADMREVDDHALSRARIFTDSKDTTLEHIGEFKIPLETGALQVEDVLADYYDFGQFTRHSNDEITLFKNGGGAHLDLMVSRYILQTWLENKG